MKLRLPSYYKEFACIADRCRHSCCLGWEIDIDEETWDYYQAVDGPFGDRLRRSMVAGEDNSFRLQAGNRCPFLNEKNLCDIVIELGETSLCAICTEYPRQTLEYADVRERCLSISCEAVGEILFSKKEPVSIVEQTLDAESELLYEEDSEDGPELLYEEDSEEGPELLYEEDAELDSEMVSENAGNTEWEYVCDEESDEEDFCSEEERGEHLRRMRDHAIAILQRREWRIENRILRYLHFCELVQECMNEEAWERMDALIEEEMALGDASKERAACTPADTFEERMEILGDMEILDEEWEETFALMQRELGAIGEAGRRKWTAEFLEVYQPRIYEYEQLMVYYTFRYLLKSVFDYRFLARAQFAVLSFLTIRDMDTLTYHRQGAFALQDRIDNARIYSREVEHSEDNLEYLAEAFMFEDVLRPEALGGQLLFCQEVSGGRAFAD